MSYIDKNRAKDCGFCSGTGMALYGYPRPCPQCQQHMYGNKPMDNLQRVTELREQIRKLESNLGALKYDLQKIEEKCGHKEWTVPERLAERVYDMETNVRWHRTCKGCGLEQSTTKTKQKTVEEPVFS